MICSKWTQNPASWKGSGANAYKYETDHILEKIQSVDDVLKAINEGALKSIREAYSEAEMDQEAYDQALILWTQGYMLDGVHQYLVKYNPEYWGNISI